jgi:hypothetical protein
MMSIKKNAAKNGKLHLRGVCLKDFPVLITGMSNEGKGFSEPLPSLLILVDRRHQQGSGKAGSVHGRAMHRCKL